MKIQNAVRNAGSILLIGCMLTLTSSMIQATTIGENEMNLIATALVSAQIQQQVREFSGLVTHVSSVKVEVKEDLDIITLTGTILRGGDIACGDASLVIQRSFERSWNGLGMQPLYRAQVISNNVCNPR